MKKAPDICGFTLLELMIVICVIFVMTGLFATSISSLTASKKLNETMDILTHGAAAARQTAVSDGYPVAFIVSAAAAGADTQQAVLFLEGIPTSTGSIQWNVSAPWQILPQEVRTTIFARNGTPSFYHSTGTPSGPIAGKLPLQWRGADITDYSYVIFRPDGTVDSPANGPSLSLARLNQGTSAVDYIVLLQENSGRSKVIEP